MDAQQLANKIEWEGGIIGALDYGIHFGDIEDPEISHAWRYLEEAYAYFLQFVNRVEDLLPNAE